MTLPVKITGTNSRSFTLREAEVTPQGAIVSAPYDYDLVSSVSCGVADVAYNMFTPRAGFQFVTTAIKLRASKDVSNTVDATVTVYEATSAISASVARTIYEDIVIRFESTTLAPVNILVNEGAFINAKTAESTVQVTITGYFVPTNQLVAS